MTKKQEFEKIAIEKAEKIKRNFDKTTRHQFDACMSAARILLGAYGAGEISAETLRNAVDALMVIERSKINKEVNVCIDDFINNCGTSSTLKTKKALLRDLIGRKKVLFIDDEYKSVGWDIVFDAILGKGKVLYSENLSQAWTSLNSHAPEIAMIFLDLRLPSIEGGLDFLKAIKESFLDLPVIMFTAEDSSRPMKKCLKNGAFDYFVKALAGEDKYSLDYYLKFKEIFSEAMRQEEWRLVWLKVYDFEKKLREAGPPYYKDITHYLRKAYFFLTIDTKTWTASVFLSDHGLTPYAEVVLQCALAEEAIMDKLFAKHKNNGILKKVFSDGEINGLQLGGKIQKLQQINVLQAEVAKQCQALSNFRVDSVHPKEKRTAMIPEGQARRILLETVDLLDHLIELI